MTCERSNSVIESKIGEWDPSGIGLIYGEFSRKSDLGVQYFNLFKEMVAGMRIRRDVKPRNKYEFTANFKDRDYYVDFRVNEKGTNMHDDYEVVEGKKAPRILRTLMNGNPRPFWIEIQNNWSNILFKDGKKRYMVQIILEKRSGGKN